MYNLNKVVGSQLPPKVPCITCTPGTTGRPAFGLQSVAAQYLNTTALTCQLSRQDNILHGRFLAELTKEVLVDLEASKYQHAEYRISIYGRKQVEWDILAAWYCQNKLYSDNVLWLIQVPISML